MKMDKKRIIENNKIRFTFSKKYDILLLLFLWRCSQAARQWSARPVSPCSNPGTASTEGRLQSGSLSFSCLYWQIICYNERNISLPEGGK